MNVRGIRGAITAAANSRESIIEATERLLRQMISANGIDHKEVAATFFTTTDDLDAEFPAAAARGLGWGKVPLICAREIGVTDRLKSCIRVLILVNTEASQADIQHIYLEGAARLRPDLAGEENPETAGSTF